MVITARAKLAVILCVCLLCAACSGFAPSGRDLPRLGDRPRTRASYASVRIDGEQVATCRLIDGVSYITAERLTRLLKLDELGVPQNMEITVSADGAYISYLDRLYLLRGPVVERSGLTLYPLVTLAGIFGCTCVWEDGGVSIDVSGRSVPVPGAEFYDETDLLWMSRIIDAEARCEPLDGKIAVGNVVLNRVESDMYPGTVYDVIFDTRFGLQFSPVGSGSIYCDPCEDSVAAAKLALEGFDVAGESLYFVNPLIGVSDWFRQTRTYVVTVGGHDFYA